nr:hypothetical protein [Tanacetum cinerariifolium]
MATTIEQQVALDEALVPSTKRLRIGRSNFRLPSDIQSKESTLQVVYDVLRRCPFCQAFLVTADVPEIYMQEFWATTIDTQQYGAILPIELTNEDIKNTMAYKEYYACATGVATPKPKANTSLTPPITTPTPITTAAPVPRITASAKGKQPAKAKKSGRGGDEVTESEGESDKEETRQEEKESFDPIPRTPEGSEDKGNDEEDQ